MEKRYYSKHEEMYPMKEKNHGLFPYFKGKQHIPFDVEAFKALPELKMNLADMVQTVGNPMIHDELSVGCDTRTFEPIACMLIADFIENQAQNNRMSEWLDYKCYRSWEPQQTKIMPLLEEKKSNTMQQEEDEDDAPFSIQGRSIIGLDGILGQNITKWCRKCLHDYYHNYCRPSIRHQKQKKSKKVFRRSLSIGLVTKFIEHLTDAGTGGHCIALAMEIRPEEKRWIHLYIFDFRGKEYLYSVHDQIFECMKEGMLHNEYRLICGIHESDFKCELVPLKEHLHYGDNFMMCVSLSYRVCMYLSFVHDCYDIHETAKIFHNDSKAFRSWIFSMINWLSHEERIKAGTVTVLQSPRQAYPLCEVSSKNCYLMLVPDAVTSALRDNCARIFMWSLQEQAVSTLHFAGLTHGIPVESQMFIERKNRTA